MAEPYRERIEDFMRRYWHKGNRMLRVLAVAVVLLLVLLLALRVFLGPAGTQTSVDRNDVVWACGRKVLPGYRGILRDARNDFAELRKDFAKGMRMDCGIYGGGGGLRHLRATGGGG